MTRLYKGLYLVWIFFFFLCPHLALTQEKKSSLEIQSDPKAMAFIRQAELKLYSPVREGLRSLSFSRPVQTPMGNLGTEKYWYQVPDDYGYQFEFNEEDPNLAPLKETMSSMLRFEKIKASETLGMYLGTFLTRDLENYIVNFIEDKKGGVRIRLKTKSESKIAHLINSKDLVFDELATIKRIKIIDSQGKTQTWNIFLKDLKDSELKIMDRIELNTRTPQGLFKTIQRFRYKEIKGFHMIVETEIEFPDYGMKLKRETTDLRINETMQEGVLEKQGLDKESHEK